MQKRTSKKEKSFTLIMMLEDKSLQTFLGNMILSKSQKNDDLNKQKVFEIYIGSNI